MFWRKPEKTKTEKKSRSKVEALSDTMRTENRGEIPTDVMGSYTGTPYDGGMPSQDADDL